MKRLGLKCSSCGGQDFVVDVCAVPRGIMLVCSCCGVITPLCVYPGHHTDTKGINGANTMELFDKSYYSNITPAALYNAISADCEGEQHE